MNTALVIDRVRTQEAVSELARLIQRRYPEARFSTRYGEDPFGIYLLAEVDGADHDDVFDVVIDQLLHYQIEEGLLLYVLPVRSNTSVFIGEEHAPPSPAIPVLLPPPLPPPRFASDHPRMVTAIAEIQERIRARFPAVSFLLEDNVHPPGTRLYVGLSGEDMEDVMDTYIGRLLDMQIEEELPLYVSIHYPANTAAFAHPRSEHAEPASLPGAG